MSDDKLEKILATYKPVEEKPGYVWLDANHIVKQKTLREVYEEEFNVGAHELSDSNNEEIANDKDAKYKRSC